MEISTRDPAAAERFQQELQYWERELTLQGYYPDAIRNRTRPARMRNEVPADLLPLLETIRQQTGLRPRVLDVGSGPLSILAYGAEFGVVDLTAVDPLMDHYAELRRRHGYEVPYPCLKGHGEDLLEQFGADRFDVVWIYNTLDHTQDPGSVLVNAVSTLAPGGYLIVQNWSREGTAQGWTGLRQHDIYLSPGRSLMCESRTPDGLAPAKCISTGLPVEVTECSEPTQDVRKWMKFVARKSA